MRVLIEEMYYKRTSTDIMPLVEKDINEDVPIRIFTLKRKRTNSPPPSPRVYAKRMLFNPQEYKKKRNILSKLLAVVVFIAVGYQILYKMGKIVKI